MGTDSCGNTTWHWRPVWAKDANSLYVDYNFDDTAAGGVFTKGMRPKSVRLPNGRLVHYTYGSAGSIADCLARLDAIQDDS
jgi:hypothetical protein